MQVDQISLSKVVHPRGNLAYEALLHPRPPFPPPPPHTVLYQHAVCTRLLGCSKLMIKATEACRPLDSSRRQAFVYIFRNSYLLLATRGFTPSSRCRNIKKEIPGYLILNESFHWFPWILVMLSTPTHRGTCPTRGLDTSPAPARFIQRMLILLASSYPMTIRGLLRRKGTTCMIA